MVGVMNVAPVCSHPSSELTDESRTIRADQLQDDRDGGQGRTEITALIVRLDDPRWRFRPRLIQARISTIGHRG